MKEKIVMPGDKLSTSEELLPGEGTFEEDGIIMAARTGEYVVDEKYRKAKVKPLTSVPVILKKGDIVIVEVGMVKSSMIIVNVIHVIGKNRSVSGDRNGTIHVKEIADGYVKDAASEFRAGDFVRAKVIQVKPSIQLATKDRDLGAIKALCVKCRHSLIKKGDMLECEHCGNRERRRIALDYGAIDLQKL